MTRHDTTPLDAEWRELIDAAAGLEAEDLPRFDRLVCWLLADLRRPIAFGLACLAIGFWLGAKR